MSEKKSLTPLIFGAVLIAVGGLLFGRRYLEFEISWWEILRLGLPILFLYSGLSKLYRHFTTDAATLRESPDKATLLGGLFWTSVGAILMLDFLDRLHFFEFFAVFWPLLLVLFGVGKIVDFYRLGGMMRFRGGEIFGLVCLIVFGGMCKGLADAHFSLLDWDFGEHVSADRDWGYRFSETENLPSEGIASLQIGNLYGDVEIQGVDGPTIQLTWTKIIRDRSERRAEEVQKEIHLTTGDRAGVLHIGTNRSDLKDRDYRFRTHFELKVPRRLPVKVINGYGKVIVSDLEADCQVENNHGRIQAEGITGNVTLKTRREPIRIRDVTGAVQIENQRGRIRGEEIVGNVTVTNRFDDISLESVTGTVELKNYHGKVNLNGISGETTIDAIGSRVTLTAMDEDVSVVNSYEALRADGLEKGLNVKTSNGAVYLTKIAGPVVIEATRADRIDVRDLGSSLTVEAVGSEVIARQVEGATKIVTSIRNVSLEGLRGKVEVQNDQGVITITSEDLKDDLIAKNSNGPITLSLPAGAAFRLSALARNGRVRCQFGGDPSRSNQFLEESFGSGGPTVRLQTENASIFVKKAE